MVTPKCELRSRAILLSHRTKEQRSLSLPVQASLLVRPLYRPFRPPSTVDGPATKGAQRSCECHSKKSQSSAEKRRGAPIPLRPEMYIKIIMTIATTAAAVVAAPPRARLVADGDTAASTKTSAARQTWSLPLNGSIGNRSDECRAWGAGQGGTSNGPGRSKAWVPATASPRRTVRRYARHQAYRREPAVMPRGHQRVAAVEFADRRSSPILVS